MVLVPAPVCRMESTGHTNLLSYRFSQTESKVPYNSQTETKVTDNSSRSSPGNCREAELGPDLNSEMREVSEYGLIDSH